LPGDSNSRIAQDLHTASDLGLDQICLYNLVLSPKLTVPWARDAKMLREMPDNHRAYKRWAYARQLLFELGYVQTTLTNFERAPVSGSRWGSGHRFSYERDSFQPQKVDALGFGPAAISTFSSADFETSVKTINAVNSHQFAADIEQSGQATRKQFVYAPQDLRLLFITRSLSLLSISKPIYRSLFGSSIEQDYAGVLSALEHRGLVTRGDSDIVPTRKGMFYADAVAGTFASPRVRALRRDMTEPEANSNIYSHM
jgi:coproporphyrinogen III oxidase-like Fe-S oxidoreductase